MLRCIQIAEQQEGTTEKIFFKAILSVFFTEMTFFICPNISP